MKKLDYILISIILVIALVFRLYKINSPLADFHSWRQADTAAVARNFVEQGFDLMHPRYDDLSNVQSGRDNPQGYRMVEFPLYNAMFAKIYQSFPNLLPLEVWGRLTSVFFSLVTIAVIYYFAVKEIGRIQAVFASLIYAVFPFFVFFSRVVLPEPTALGMGFLAIFLLYKNPKSILNVALSVILFSLSLLIKPTMIFFGLAIFFIFVKTYRWSIIRKPIVYIFFILSVLPLLWWRRYILAFPDGIPGSEWLITSVNVSGGLEPIFFRPAFFRWVFFERINNIILGGYMTVFFVIGVVKKQKNFFLLSILLSSLAYLFIFQGGNVQHEYYQTLILPALAIFCALGLDLLIQAEKIVNKFILTLVVLAVFGFSWFMSYYHVKDYYSYSADLVQMGKIINSLTEKNDLIVTDQTGDTTLLYLASRRGAPALYKNPEELKNLGYSYLTTSSSYMINQMKTQGYLTVFENDKFTMFHL